MRPVLTLRDDSIAVATSVAKAPIPTWVSCRYGDSLDSAEPCVLTLVYTDPVLSLLAVRDVLYLRDEAGVEREYRVRSFKDSLNGAVVEITATPLLVDLNDVLVTTTSVSGLTTALEATHPVSGWWTFVIAPALARRGTTHWQLGTVELEEIVTLSLDNSTVLGLLRQLIDGSVYTLSARLTSGVYYVDIRVPSVAYRPKMIVGVNVEALDRDVDSDLQVTRAYPNGASLGTLAKTTIAGTPWKIGAAVGSGLEILDPEYNTADFAIEPDQFAPSTAADFDGYVMLASRGGEARDVPTVGSSVRWIETITAAKRRIFVPCANGTGEVQVFDFATNAWLTPVSVVTYPQGSCYAPSSNRVYITCVAGADVGITAINPDTLAKDALIAAGSFYYHILYVASLDRVILCGGTTGLAVMNPATNAITAISGGTGSGGYHIVNDGEFLWLTNGGSNGIVKKFTLAATPVFIEEFDAGLEAGAGAVTMAVDTVNNKLWLSYWVGNKVKVVNRTTGALITTIDTAVTPNAGVPRYLHAYNGTVYTTHTTGRLGRWNGATNAHIDLTTVDASGGQYWAMTPLAFGESSVLLAGDGRRLGWWDLATHSTKIVRAIAGVTAGSPSVVEMGGGTTVPFTTGDRTELLERDLTPVTSLPSPTAIAVYGEIERPYTYANAPLVPNMTGDPDLEVWTTDSVEKRYWDLPSPLGGVSASAPTNVSLGVVTASGTGTAFT